VHHPGVFVCPSSVCSACSHCICTHVSFLIATLPYMTYLLIFLARIRSKYFIMINCRHYFRARLHSQHLQRDLQSM
jgi:hypothetical protein